MNIQTPNKHGKLVVTPSCKRGTFDSHAVDCPFPKDGVLHHFYCAVAPARDKHQGEIVHGEVRGISLATDQG